MKKHIYISVLFLGILIQFISESPLHAQGFILVPDTIDLTPLIPKTVNVLTNDVIPPGDSVEIIYAGSSGYVQGTVLTGGFVTFVANYDGNKWGYYPVVTGSYSVHDYTLDTVASAHLIFRIRDYSYDSLTVNNINARFQANGSHFFGPDHARFEVPKFSGKNTIYSSNFWIGGLDQDSVLHLAAQMYGQGPQGGLPHSQGDFFAGPVMDSTAYSIYQDTLWNYVWNLTKAEIEYHKAHWSDAGYHPIHDILTWPGNGNVALGQAAQLAPYFDRNNDGIYNPMDGDYPLIRGDQALFFIFNDDRRIHSETEGEKVKVEIQGMAYAFDLPGDSAFWNTVFLNYKIINRSDKIYYKTYLGVFTDLDIGWPMDDYIGCDVERGMYYGYNGNPVDGNGQPGTYGANPPAQSVTFLGGPYLDPDGCDNPSFKGNSLKGPSFHGDCSIVGLDSTTILMHYGPGNADSGYFIVRDEAINGINFGDSIPDNERRGMSRFIFFNNDGTLQGNPKYSPDYYSYLRGLWKDGVHMTYGGNGYNTGEPSCDFSFPELSDTCNWGTNGAVPSQKLWTETTAGDAPGDRRGVGSSGPFTFNPGQAEEFDIAYTFARDYTGNYTGGSIGKLQNLTDTIRKSFISNFLPDGNSFNGIAQQKSNDDLLIQIFPNPASAIVNIKLNRYVNEAVTIRIINANGILIRTEKRTAADRMITIDLTGLSSGLYVLSVETKNQIVTKKLSVVK
jgi:hypothetical protein